MLYRFALILLGGFLFLARASSAEEPDNEVWTPKKGPLHTPWTEKVSAEQPRCEYPRPLLVRDNWLCLNGLWDYAVQPRDRRPPPSEYAGKILVPFPIESSLSGVMRPLNPSETLWYRRYFQVPEGWQGKRILLHFDAVDWESQVWFNGKLLGTHRGGYDAFEFDITENLRPSGPQELVVGVWDPTDTFWQLRGKQSLRPEGCSYTACSGIWQTVWLEAVPPAYLEEVSHRTELQGGKGRVHLKLAGRMPPDHSVRLQIELRDGDTPVARTELSHQIPAFVKKNLVDFFQARSTWFSVETVLTVDPAKPWSPDSPKLYDLFLELHDENSQTVDRVRSYVGIREVSIGQSSQGHPVLLLNGQPMMLVGALDQGYWPDGIYTAPTDEALRFDIEVAKQLGLNAVRKHVKVEPPRWYYWCDRLGLLVLQDFPSGGVGDPKTDRACCPEAAAQWETEVRQILRQFGDHPSIIMWIIFNEGWGQFDTLRNVEWVKRLDPTRLVNEASGFPWHGGGDVIDSHGGTPPRDGKRIGITSEDGGWGACPIGHCWNESRAWAYRTYEPETWRPVDGIRPPLPPLTEEARDWLTRWIGRLYQGFWRNKEIDGRCGYFYTQLVDVETECNGLLSYDRALFKVKPEILRTRVIGPWIPSGLEILPTAPRGGTKWRFTTERPSADWPTPDFDDSRWSVGLSGFGRRGTPGAVVRTDWTTGQIWLRGEFGLSREILARREQLRLRIHHDEDVVVYLNGVEAFREAGFLTSYDDVELNPQAVWALRPGRNLIAVTCQQTEGGQYVDVGLVLPDDSCRRLSP
jgi:hypothetical protein